MNSFMGSEGCRLSGPTLTQRMLPFTSRPMPGTKTSRRSRMPTPRSIGLADCHALSGMRVAVSMASRPMTT